MILLNLSSIPDEVAKKFDFKYGFQKDLLKDMEDYKRDFKKRYGVAWKKANQATMNEYLTFKRWRDVQLETRKTDLYENSIELEDTTKSSNRRLAVYEQGEESKSPIRGREASATRRDSTKTLKSQKSLKF